MPATACVFLLVASVLLYNVGIHSFTHCICLHLETLRDTNMSVLSLQQPVHSLLYNVCYDSFTHCSTYTYICLYVCCFLHLQGGSAAATGKAGARRAAVLRAAAASLAEPPCSGPPPTRTPPGLPARGRHQWPCDREAPRHLHGDDRSAPGRRRRRRPFRTRPPAPPRTPAPVPDDGLVQAERAPRCVYPQRVEGSVLPEVPAADRIGRTFPVQGADLLPLHPRADPEGRVAGTSTCGGCREEGGPARVRHFGVCAHALPLCIHVCMYMYVRYLCIHNVNLHI